MPDDMLRYDVLTQDALRGVVKAALKIAAKNGLPGDHHFFIAFNTNTAGVKISERLKQKYPKEMTIVLQHQYWNLLIRDDDFEVELSFNDIPERLVIPFRAVKGFLDPSVQFGLQFETVDMAASEAEPATAPEPIIQTQPKTDEGEPEAPKVVSLDAFRKK